MPINAKQQQDRRPAYETLSKHLRQSLLRLVIFDFDDGIGLQVPPSRRVGSRLENKLQNIRGDFFVGKDPATGSFDE
jgi:hypothetical protein